MPSREVPLVFLVSFLFLFSFVSCWGDDGHLIVGQVASQFLTNSTRVEIGKLLGSYSLANISIFADNYDRVAIGAWSKPLHYVNLPTDALTFTYASCFSQNEPPGCVISAISNITQILKEQFHNGTLDICNSDGMNSEPCPLSFLAHFVGDSHEPLHLGYDIDAGANFFNVIYDNVCTELHAVWDSRLIFTYMNDNNLGWFDVAMSITKWLKENPETYRQFTSSMKPSDWGDESFTVTRFAPYNTSPGSVIPSQMWFREYFHSEFNESDSKYSTTLTAHTRDYSPQCGPILPYQYYQRNIPIVFEQLAKAGARLGFLLNQIYS